MKDRLGAIRDRIERACDVAGRDPGSVTLIAVSKGFSADAMLQAFDLGCRHFGENRLQEAETKLASLPAEVVAECTWHFIGKLQSRKVLGAATRFQVLHTLETDSQLAQLAKLEAPIDALIEVNVASEPQKSGRLPSELAAFVQKVRACRNARLRGLMTMGPALSNAEQLRPFFSELRQLGKRCDAGEWLSMGMSGDFDVAIQEGATHVRIGGALFGTR